MLFILCAVLLVLHISLITKAGLLILEPLPNLPPSSPALGGPAFATLPLPKLLFIL